MMGTRRFQIEELKIANRLMELIVEIESEIPVFRSITGQMVKKFGFKKPFKSQICGTR